MDRFGEVHDAPARGLAAGAGGDGRQPPRTRPSSVSLKWSATYSTMPAAFEYSNRVGPSTPVAPMTSPFSVYADTTTLQSRSSGTGFSWPMMTVADEERAPRESTWYSTSRASSMASSDLARSMSRNSGWLRMLSVPSR